VKKPTPAQRAEIWKFGGASLMDAGAIQRAVTLITASPGPLVVVASALGGITDLLLEGATAAVSGQPGHSARVAATFLRRHREIVKALLPPGKLRRNRLADVDAAAREYRELCVAIGVLGHLAPRASDRVVSRGERMSAAILAAALVHAGRQATVIDAEALIVTDAQHEAAAPNLPETRRRTRQLLRPVLASGAIGVVPGFIGEAPDGSVTTLGRGGSDLTATLLGRCLGVRRIVLWKDVPGILTSDPRLVPDARLIHHLHHREAAELAHYGAKVLHPRALIPMTGTRTILHVRSFVNPDAPGTEISARRPEPGYPVKALAIVADQAIVTVAGKGMVGVHGIAARTFGALEAERLSVSTIFQASSESSIGFTLPAAESDRAVGRLRAAFREELEAGLIDSVTAQAGVAVIAVVGDGMAGTPGIAARVFSALAAARINIVAIAQGSSERNISFAVDARNAEGAARAVHATFQLSKLGGGRSVVAAHTDVVLLGFGRVGRAVAAQITSRNGAGNLRVVGLLDTSGYLFDPRGLTRHRVLTLARKKEAGGVLATLGGEPGSARNALTVIARHAVSRPVLVDLTSEDTGDLLQFALAHGFAIVLANKKPLAGSWDSYAALADGPSDGSRRVRYEATVGAGLPIIDTYHKLVETGDRVLRIDGCVSGTLTFVMSALSSGRSFSEAVREAVARGYAEPDPREDLSGRDAGRKALIVARLMGYQGPAPAPENLVPRGLRSVPPDVFMKRIAAHDQEWTARVQREAARGHVLRYVVTATSRAVSARLAAVPVSGAIGSLQGTRNLVAFTTRRYAAEPVVVSGPGAGPEVTAAGILNDIDSLARHS
jgi:bifunctional aspartokinase / homoserine dehydrogenase 1